VSLFVFVEIRSGSSGFNAAQAVDVSATDQHRFAEHGFSGACVAHDGHIPDVVRFKSFHDGIPMVETLDDLRASFSVECAVL
jgi:hypothetical protein